MMNVLSVSDVATVMCRRCILCGGGVGTAVFKGCIRDTVLSRCTNTALCIPERFSVTRWVTV